MLDNEWVLTSYISYWIGQMPKVVVRCSLGAIWVYGNIATPDVGTYNVLWLHCTIFLTSSADGCLNIFPLHSNG